MALITGSDPYPWPWHGSFDPRRCAVVVCRHPRWRGAGDAATEVDQRVRRVVEAVAAAGGTVIETVPPGPGERAEPVITSGTTTVVETPGIDGFYGSDLEGVLRRGRLRDLVLTGWGLEGPVHSTMRSANDRGYECLLLTDATTPVDPALADAARSTIVMSGGIFGAVGTSAQVFELLETVAAAATNLVPDPPGLRPTADLR